MDNIGLIANRLSIQYEELAKQNEKLREERDSWQRVARRCEEEKQSVLQEVVSLTKLVDYDTKQLEKYYEREQKLIDGLRWYAGEQYGDVQFFPPIPDIPILHDCGEKAQAILKEIGVTP